MRLESLAAVPHPPRSQSCCFQEGEHNQQPPPKSPSACAAAMRAYCKPEAQARGMFMRWDAAEANTTLAAFLIARPPLAYLVSRATISAIACQHPRPVSRGQGGRLSDADWHPLFALDVGEPAGGAVCAEQPSGVFSRRYTKLPG